MPPITKKWSEIELLRDVQTAVEQIAAGKGVSNREAQRRLRKRFVVEN